MSHQNKKTPAAPLWAVAIAALVAAFGWADKAHADCFSSATAEELVSCLQGCLDTCNVSVVNKTTPDGAKTLAGCKSACSGAYNSAKKRIDDPPPPCPSGQVRRGRKCVPKGTSCSAKGQIKNSAGDCVCPSGTRLNKAGTRCVEKTLPPPPPPPPVGPPAEPIWKDCPFQQRLVPTPQYSEAACVCPRNTQEIETIISGLKTKACKALWETDKVPCFVKYDEKSPLDKQCPCKNNGHLNSYSECVWCIQGAEWDGTGKQCLCSKATPLFVEKKVGKDGRAIEPARCEACGGAKPRYDAQLKLCVPCPASMVGDGANGCKCSCPTASAAPAVTSGGLQWLPQWIQPYEIWLWILLGFLLGGLITKIVWPSRPRPSRVGTGFGPAGPSAGAP